MTPDKLDWHNISTKPDRRVFEEFPSSFRIHVHQLIAWGHEVGKDKILTTVDEEEITGYLRDAIQKVLRSGQLGWFIYYAVRNEDPFSSIGRAGHNRRELDLVIEFTYNVDKPEYIIECKPLNGAKKHQLTGNYLNENGLQRFIKGEYAEYTSIYPEVAMVGYVLSDSVEVWREKIKKSIRRSRKLRLKSPQRDVVIIDEFPSEWVSEHERDTSKTPIQVYHILISCC